MAPMHHIGLTIKELREKNKMTMKELSSKVGISEAMISYYESGDRSPKMGTLESIATVLGTSVKEMMFPEETTPITYPDIFTDEYDLARHWLNEQYRLNNLRYMGQDLMPDQMSDEEVIAEANDIKRQVDMVINANKSKKNMDWKKGSMGE